MKRIILILMTVLMLSGCSPMKGPDDYLMVYSVTSSSVTGSNGGVKVLIKSSQGVNAMELRYDEIPSWAISGRKIDIVLVE